MAFTYTVLSVFTFLQNSNRGGKFNVAYTLVYCINKVSYILKLKPKALISSNYVHISICLKHTHNDELKLISIKGENL